MIVTAKEVNAELWILATSKQSRSEQALLSVKNSRLKIDSSPPVGGLKDFSLRSKRHGFTQGCMGRGTSGAPHPMFLSPQLHHSPVFSKERSSLPRPFGD